MYTVELRLGQMGIITLTVCLHIVHFAREVLKTTKKCPVGLSVSAHYLTAINMARRSQDYQFNQSKVSIDLSESRKKCVLFELIYNFSSKNVKICCFLNGMICFVIFDSKLWVLDGTEKQFEDITLGSEKQLVYTGGKISRLYFRFNARRIS